VVTCLTGLVFGIAPALRATRVSLNDAMKEQSRSVVGTGSVIARILLIVQVAVSLVLLVGAGLFLRTVQNLRHVDVGFNPNQLVLFRVNPQLNRYDEARTFALYADMMERLRSAPGVRAVALSQPALLSGSVNSTAIFVQGRAYPRGARKLGDEVSINRVVVSPSFFDTLEMPVIAGRGFSPHDEKGAPRVALINDAAARKYFPSQNPIGQRFGSSPEDSGRLEIVGIVRDAKYNDLREPAPPTMYVPYLQNGGSAASAMFEVRTAGEPAAVTTGIRDIVRRIDPNLPLTNMSTQLEQVEQRYGQEKVFAHACTLFGGLALLLASIGLFGLMSYNVARRTNEIGIRMALGAQRQDVLRLVMGESLWMVLVGVGIGLAISLASSRFVASLLFGVRPADAATLVGVTLLMVLVSAVAGFLPARRASRIDPLVALHEE
jgi:predicted permease